MHPVTRVQAETRLADWMQSNPKEWNVRVIANAIPSSQLAQVLAVPIPMVSCQDTLKWPFERGGKITVRSAYHFIRSKEEGQPASSVETDRSAAPNLWGAV